MFKLSTLLFCIWLVLPLLAQEGIQTESNLEVENLVRDIFIKGNCRNVSNISAIGNEILSIGQFESGSSTIDIGDGIILSTGDISLAIGPNIDNEAGFALNDETIDPDLVQLATGTLFDVTGIEFDFIPLDDRVTFSYVFASEEYCEFVGTSFNDVFGFFVSGPGISGPYHNEAINVATLFGSNDDVSINTVNHLDNTAFYVSNVTTIDAENCDIGYSPIYQDLIEYDGFTVPLTASFEVIPCETYHIRLVIGDVGDAILDSAVFLESKSFDLGEKTNIRAEVPGREEPIAYEGCADGQFVFTRGASSSINEDCTIAYTISPDSEALNGVDFVEIPLSITIPAGETEYILPIIVIEDNIDEGPERIKLEFIYDCDCIDPVQSELIINEVEDFSITFEPITVCAGQAFGIAPEITGGVPPFNFLWDTGEQTEILEALINQGSQYSLTVTDFCGASTSGFAIVNVQDVPIAFLDGSYDFCEIAETGIPVLLGGNPPWSIIYSIDGQDQPPIENIQSSPFNLPVLSPGNYMLTTFNDAFCEGNTMGSATVDQNSFSVSTEIIPPSCVNAADGSISITQLEAITPFDIEWDIPGSDNYSVGNLTAGNYLLRITDGNGCVYEETFELTALLDDASACNPVYIPNSFSPNNDGVNDIFTIYFDDSEAITGILAMQIFDRWGSLVFEQNTTIPSSENIGWDGTSRGQTLSPGVFIYQVLITYKNGNTQLLSGDVTLLR